MAAPRSWREVAEGYDAGAATYDQRRGDRRHEKRRERIEAPLLAAARGRDRVLEIGVGTGRILSRVAREGARLAIGIDVSAAMLDQAAKKRLAVLRADAHHLPFAARSFDAILAGGGVFRYLDAGAALAECARVLVGGGALAIHQFGAKTWSPRRPRRPDPRVRELAHVDELTSLAERHGFAVARVVRWRSLPVVPHLIEIPAWIDRRSPVQLWSQVVVVLHRT